MAVDFPSVEWFQTLADMANEDPVFQKFGRMNALVVFKIGDSAYNVTFDVLTVGDVRAVEESALRDADFVIEISPEKWRGMIEDIKANGTAGRDWTLNTLDLLDDEPIHKNFAEDGFAADKFFRYNPSLQQFMDNSRELETNFTLEGATA
jgi:hypothetical protein